ncbi:response regulator [Verrucomicrobiota bacterium sgz303538]
MTARASASTTSPDKNRRRIFLVEDHPMMRDGLRRLIDGEPGLSCCGDAGSAETTLDAVARSKPDLLITDITLPGRSGLDLIKDIRAAFPEVQILVFSMHDEMFYAERALKAGARGYLMKEAGSEKMLEAIQRILAGEIAVSPRISAKILDIFSGQSPRSSNSPVEKLTDREFDVYRLIGQGKTTKEIADQLHLSHKTVAVHRGHIKEKLGLDSATELVHHAVRWVETQDSERAR